jgi:16S rRNA processing protein RimM
MSGPEKPVWIGRIAGPYGVRGWVKVVSDTDPLEKIAEYTPWWLSRQGQWSQVGVEAVRSHAKGLVAKLEGCEDRDAAARLNGAQIAVERDALQALPAGEYYWTDLIGLRVKTVGGVDLGVVDHLIETGANDVLVIKGERERLVPYLRGEVVKTIDLDGGLITVDWDPEF